MPQHFQKPETALKRARELQAVQKPALALETLHSLITNRRHRTWTKTHEEIMKLYIDLCIHLQKGRTARDGLHQYKNITGQTAVGSLDTVIQYFLDQAETTVREAREKLDADAKVDADDLDATASPESILLAAVSDEDAKDRTDRAVFVPLLRFLWETYRTVLDILRNNSRLETLYQTTARRAFKFCFEYERKPEFRRLCDLLRQHLAQIQKYQNQANAVDLDNPDTVQALLETRFEQLSVAADLELWQEAFKAVEDISNLMAKKEPKASGLYTYYKKLTLVFWKSEDFAFHALAHLKLLALLREVSKKPKPEELQLMASSVVLATLAVPVKVIDNETKVNSETAVEKQLRLALLLGVTSVPSREDLMRELISTNMLAMAAPELQDLFRALEEDFNPLELCKKIGPMLEYIEKQPKLAQYSARIKQIAMMRLMKQLSQVYTSMRFKRVCQLVPFATEFEIEKFLVQAVKARLLQLRLCHRTRSINFETNVFVTPDDAGSDGQLQLLQSEMMRTQLTTLSMRLSKALTMINPEDQVKGQQQRTKSVVQNAIDRISQEHEAILERKKIIENRKEFIEKETMNKRKKQRAQILAEAEEKRQKEAERLAAEALERERIRQQREREEIVMQQNMQRIESLRSNTMFKDLFKDVTEEDLKNLDGDLIMKKQVEELEKTKREQAQKQRTVEKRVDYFERAKRLVEIPILQEHFKTLCEQNKKFHEQQQAVRREQSKKEHAVALEAKQRLARVTKYKEEYTAGIVAAAREKYEVDLAGFRDAMKRQALRKKELEEEAKRKAEQEKIDRENREREEAERKERERVAAEEAAKRKEEEDKKRAEERKKRQAELDAIAEKQRAREAEIEARLEAERQAVRERAAAPPSREPDTWRREGPDRRSARPEPRGQDEWRRGGDPRGDPRRDGPPRREMSGGRDEWRRGPRDEPAGRRDDRGPPAARTDSGPWRRGDAPQRREEPSRDEWRRSDPRGAPRRDGPPARSEGRDEWRRGGPPQRGGAPAGGRGPSGGRDEWRRGGDDRRGPSGQASGDSWRRGDKPAPRGDARRN